MADNVAITAGSGTTIATDDIGAGVQVQRVKPVWGADGVGNDTSDTNPLPISARRDLQRIAVTSGGLTTATTAYSAGDQVGTQFTFANAARASGGSGTIVAAVLISAADIIGPYDMVITDSTITLAADNAAYAISDANSLKVVAILQLSGAYDIGNNRIAQVYNVAVPYVCTGTDLFAGLITRAAHTFFGATTDIQIDLYVERN